MSITLKKAPCLQKYLITTCSSVNAIKDTILLDIHNASSGIEEGIGCNLLTFVDNVSSNRVISENSNTIWRELRGKHFNRKNWDCIPHNNGDTDQ